jgi:hypothetical protein
MKNIKNFKIEYILISVLIVGLVLILGSFFKQLNFADNSQQIKKGERVEIVVGDTLEQKFTSEYDGLSNLKILFGNKTLREENSLQIALADKECRKNIIKKTIEGKYELDSRYLYDFNFPKIDASKNKEYCLKIELKTELQWTFLRKIKSKFKTEKKQKTQKIRLFEQDSKKDSIKKYVIKNKSGKIKIQGQSEVVFRQGHKNDNITKDLQQLNQRMSQYKPWFLKGYCVTIGSVIATILSIVSGVVVFSGKIDKDKKDSKFNI